MGVETRQISPDCQIFRVEEISSISVAELFEAAAKWIRKDPEILISVIDISLHSRETGPDTDDLELDVYFE
jgi:hypothetical protein